MIKRAREARDAGVSFVKSAPLMDISPATLYRWDRYRRAGKIKKLIPRSRRPRRVRETTLSRGTIERFVALRNEHLGLGGRKIAVMLRREGHIISFAQGDRLVTKLLNLNRIVPARSWGGKGVFTSKRLPFLPPPTPKLPGDLAEIDSVAYPHRSGNDAVSDNRCRRRVAHGSRLSMRRAYQRCCSQSD